MLPVRENDRCGPDSVSCKGAGCLCLCLDLGLPLVAAGGALLLAVAGLVLRWRWGIPLQGTNLRGLLFSTGLRSLWSLPRELAGPSSGVPLVPLVLPLTIGCRSLHQRVSQTFFWRWWVGTPLPPSGWSAVPDTDPRDGGYACPGSRKGRARVETSTRVPNSLGWTIGFSGGFALVLRAPPQYHFFPEVHDELTGSWTAHFTARKRSSGSSSLTTLDGGAARGLYGDPLVERSVAMQLCPNTPAATWRGNPLLPCRAL